ncbi:hypothetical protein BDV95DRAFT_597337 [Massariosphaeria phaeospora]|uniref:J domain-containing protein n=1 Tax=Massariosphaeria phaeospora TaxID=100035 RepID=A0A7C8MFZ9_9PLEO|nr:hypothetical protein BDV95DRAFT_597337 [Massariosphaeria phaeospora]
MPLETHYETLGLSSAAPASVIRAAYKALALIHHPDKTQEQPPSERSHHSILFRDIQEAYDVLGTPSLRAAYDTELSRHDNKVDRTLSTFHHTRRTPTSTPSTPTRRRTMRATTPDEKRAMKAKIEHEVAQLQAQRVKRDAEDASIDTHGLKFMARMWKEIGEEHKGDQALWAYCVALSEHYGQRVAAREAEHEQWLNDLSTARAQATRDKNTPASARADSPHVSTAQSSPARSVSPPAPAPASPSKSPTPSSPTTTPPPPRQPPRPASHPRKAKPNTPTAQDASRARAQSRATDLARQHSAKQARLSAKAAAVRAEKELQKRKAEDKAQKEADRIAKARAKAAAAPKGYVAVSSKAKQGGNTTQGGKAGMAAGKVCGKCGEGHKWFGEWIKCNRGELETETEREME